MKYYLKFKLASEIVASITESSIGPRRHWLYHLAPLMTAVLQMVLKLIA